MVGTLSKFSGIHEWVVLVGGLGIWTSGSCGT